MSEDVWKLLVQIRGCTTLTNAAYAEHVLALLVLKVASLEELQEASVCAQDLEGSGSHCGERLNGTLRALEIRHAELAGALPSNYQAFQAADLLALLTLIERLAVTGGRETLTSIWDTWHAWFASEERGPGSEWFSPFALRELLAEILAPTRGSVFDPACGSGGFLVASARYAARHGHRPLMLYGQEKVWATMRVCKMNLFLHGLHAELEEANSFYEGRWHGRGHFETVVVEPHFNIRGFDPARMCADDPRYPFGVAGVKNANSLWLQLCYSALSERGRAGIVLPNAAGNAMGAELAVRRRLVQEGVVDVILSVGTGLFWTSTMSCTLWFLDKGKRSEDRASRILFIDVSSLSHRIARGRSDFAPEVIEYIANIVRLYRGESVETLPQCGKRLQETFPSGRYRDVPGLCRSVERSEVEAQGWSLLPGRYIDANHYAGQENWKDQLRTLQKEMQTLTFESHHLEEQVRQGIRSVLEG